ncbi:DUF664 domain-containing protein [Streptomyces sp. NPDC001941]|uniref:mycothiol transferase n=1 Tax=Streptomyces sp. NPDC001941 TaxID=3154659 RepID=UPI0033290C78
MFVGPGEDPRTDGAFRGERAVLAGYLRDQRLTLELKCSGLGPADLARRAVEPSSLSLLGLLRHLADVELKWFRVVMAGETASWHFRTPDDLDAAFDDALPDAGTVAAAWAAWRAEVAFAERFTDGAASLGVTGTRPDGKAVELREVLVHMIEEYARHNGHADLLRERIDGRVGQ